VDKIEIRKKILKFLYQEYEKTPGHGHGSLPDIAQEIGVDYKEVDFNAQYLSDKDFVRLGIGRTIEITPKGVDFVEGPHEFNPRSEHISQSFEIGDIKIDSGSLGDVVQTQNIGGVVQTHTTTINPSVFFESIIHEIQNQPDLDPTKKKSWLRSLSEMMEHPMILEIFRKIFESIRF